MDTIFQIETFDNFQIASQEILTNLYIGNRTNSTLLLQTDAKEKAKHEMRTIIYECNFDKHKVTNYFNNKEWDEEKITYFVNIIESNWSELLGSALNHYNSSYGETVINFDWIVKYVVGTSELKTLKYPLLQLIMTLVNKTGQQNRILYDINKDMLLKMINVLENI